MSRAYRIRVSDSLHRVLRAGDRVSTRLEILEVLPPEQMGKLLASELERRGYKRDGNMLSRTTDGVTVTVDVGTSTVTVAAQACEEVELKGEREGRAYDEAGRSAKDAREQLRRQLQSDLDKQAADKEAALQTDVTDRLEGKLCDLRQELDQVSNRVTAEALKIKAAQLGQIKEMTEDVQTGSLTIVLEV
jgi:hypothetical protein